MAALQQSVLVDPGHVAGVLVQFDDAEVRPAGRGIVQYVDVDADAIHVHDAEIQTLLQRLRPHVLSRPGRQPVLRQRPLVLHALNCRQKKNKIGRSVSRLFLP